MNEIKFSNQLTSQAKRKSFRHFWRGVADYSGRAYKVAAPYWQSKDVGKMAWFLLIVLLLLTFGRSLVLGKISYATADVINILEKRNFDDVGRAFLVWVGATGIFVAFSLVAIYVTDQLIIRWRQFMTHRFLGKYLRDDVYHQMEVGEYDIDNPDQRIAQDTHLVAERTLMFGLRALQAVVMTAVFGTILWKVSGSLDFTFAGNDISIPGYMFWAAIIYSVLIVYVTHKIGKPLIPLNIERQRREADFRYDFVRLRENTESIALLFGAKNEGRRLKERFSSVRKNWLDILKYKMRITAFNDALSQLSTFFPYLVAMPALISGTVAIGSFLQLRMAFLRVEAQLTFFASAYEQLAEWKSSVDRVLDLEDSLGEVKSDKYNSQIVTSKNEGENFAVQDLSLELPTGHKLLDNVSFEFEKNKNVVVTGASGCGKSTLFRALFGLWVWGKGTIELPKGSVMFLPQKPYLPVSNLREALIYPNHSNFVSDERLKDKMEKCLLGKFTDSLDQVEDWARILSGGEQQRLSIVRAILNAPDWLFLDESTSALDPKTEGLIYTAIKKELPDTTIVSIAHRESLKQYHDKELRIDPGSKSIEIKTVTEAVT